MDVGTDCVLNRVTLAIAEVVDGELAGRSTIYGLQFELVTVQALLVKHETLRLVIVLWSCLAAGEDTVVRVKSKAVHLECQVAALGQLATDCFETLFGCEGSLFILCVVWRWRTSSLVHSLADGVSVPLALAVGRWVGHIWHVGKAVVRVGEVESLGQISHVSTTPCWDFRSLDVVSFGGEPFFDELDLRGVVGVFDIDVATTGPWRNDVEGQTETWAGVGVAEFAVWVLNPFADGTVRRMVGDDVVTLTTSLIV